MINMRILNLLIFLVFCVSNLSTAQELTKEWVEKIVKEANDNSMLEQLAHELVDEVGPRLVGSPQMDRAHEWVKETYSKWGVNVEKQVYGQWRGWDRGITHVDMMVPWIKSLEAVQLAWNPNMEAPIETEVVTLPMDAQSISDLIDWTEGIKGKVVLASLNPFSGRPEHQWKEFALEEDFEKYKNTIKEQNDNWTGYLKRLGLNSTTLIETLEDAGAAGVFVSNWSGVVGASRIFDAKTKSIPMINIMLEDYGLLYRLAENGKKPMVRLFTQSRDLGAVDAYNTIARIEGKDKPNEYIVLSAHLDSWDGATGATDNGTGTIIMMETARILKKILPQPKRTILIGHWGSEEQGLNGSRAFVQDNPEVIQNTKVAFNQDNGTGRVINISGQGFARSYEYLNRWMEAVPKEITDHINTTFPGMPSSGGSDHAAFSTAGIPGISLSSLNWGYFGYTWHTNRDTYDKIVFDEVRRNVILTTILTYMAAQDEDEISHEKRIMPRNKNGETMQWPEVRQPNRKGRLD